MFLSWIILSLSLELLQCYSWSAGRPRPAGRARRPSLHRITHHALAILLPPQNHSGLDASQHSDRQDGRYQSHGNAAGEHVGEYAEARHHRRVEVGSSDPDGDADADEEAENRAHPAHGRGFA